MLLLVVLEVVNCLVFLIQRDCRRPVILINPFRENRPEILSSQLLVLQKHHHAWDSAFRKSHLCCQHSPVPVLGGPLLRIPSMAIIANSLWHLIWLNFICVYFGFHLFFHIFSTNAVLIEPSPCVSPLGIQYWIRCTWDSLALKELDCKSPMISIFYFFLSLRLWHEISCFSCYTHTTLVCSHVALETVRFLGGKKVDSGAPWHIVVTYARNLWFIQAQCSATPFACWETIISSIKVSAM